MHDELRLTPIALRRDHHLTGHIRRDRRAEVVAHHVDAQIKPGRRSRRREHIAIVDEQNIGVDLDLGNC